MFSLQKNVNGFKKKIQIFLQTNVFLQTPRFLLRESNYLHKLPIVIPIKLNIASMRLAILCLAFQKKENGLRH